MALPESFKRAVYRTMKGAGLAVQRYRDPYADLQRLLSPTGLRAAVDGGAFHGGHTKQLLSLFPKANVYAFEPQPDTLERLQVIFANEPRVRVCPYALSDSAGTAKLHVNEQPYTTSLLSSNDQVTITPQEVRDVSVTTLDDWVAAEKAQPPEFVKLDLQGNELAALRGAKTMLANDVRAVFAEVNFRSRYDGGCVYHEVAEYLSQFGFRLFRMYEIIADPDGAWRQADALFLKGD
jgi:FkbM family methyltransferase